MADEERGKVWGLVVALPIAVVLGLFAIAIVAVIMSPHAALHEIGDAVAASLIGSLLTAALVWGVLQAVFIRHRAPERSQAYLLIIFAAVVLIDGGLVMIGVAGHKLPALNNSPDLREQTITLQEIPRIVHVAYSPHGGAYRINSRSPGAGGDVARATLEWMKTVTGSHDLYENDLKALNLDSYMHARALAAPGGLANARAILAKMRDSARRHRAEEDVATAKFRAILAASGVDPAIKGQMFTAFDSAVARGRVMQDAIYADDEGVATEYAAIVARLAQPAGVWYVDGNLIRFTDHSDVIAFKAHIAKAKQYADAKRAIFNAPY